MRLSSGFVRCLCAGVLCLPLLSCAPGRQVTLGEPVATPETDPVTQAFSGHDPESTGSVDHSVWSEFLSTVTLDVGRSRSRLELELDRSRMIGSNLKYGSSRRSRFENNRVAFHLLEDEAIELVRAYRQGLEHISERIDLTWLDRDEQLAYWLNLYNATVMEQLLERYPLSRLERLREELWGVSLLEVAGHSLSLRDIETRILFPLWDDPLILYGLWQGAVGGPKLRRRAFTADNVWDLLHKNAREFVNSNRGMRPWSTKLHVSLLYAWGAPLFANEKALIRHITSYADPPFSEGLEPVKRLDFDLYNWKIADLNEGTQTSGQWNQLGGLLTGSVASAGNDGTGTPSILGDSNFLNNLMTRSESTDLTHLGLSPEGVVLLRGIAEFNRNDNEPQVTVEACPPDDEACKSESERESSMRRQR